MALTDCPSCGKKISDKSKSCSHCGFVVGDASSDDIIRKKNLAKFHKIQSIQNQSMLAMLLFIGGFGFMYWGNVRTGDMQHTAAMAGSVIGFVWYLVNRVRLVVAKRAG